MPPVKLRLEYLDGIRGLAALYVVFFHASEELYDFNPEQFTGWLKIMNYLLSGGHYAVGVFIVLSGYCLMLPVARSANGQLKGGFKGYIQRRARRIVPTYYAAIVFVLALMWMVPAARNSQATRWSLAKDSFRWEALLSHVFLVHNLNPAWLGQIASPMWSVATEWQIYFVFGLLLLPIWQRFGNLAAILGASGLGIAITFAFPSLDGACFWFIGLFAFGMAAATKIGKTDAKETRRWGIAAAAFAVLLVGLSLKTHLKDILIEADFLVGGGAACLLIYCAGKAQHGGSPLLRVFESKAALWLGMFSYSLYLIHFPILATLHLATNALHWPFAVKYLIELTVGVGLSVASAALFYRFAERPFTRTPAAVKI